MRLRIRFLMMFGVLNLFSSLAVGNVGTDTGWNGHRQTVRFDTTLSEKSLQDTFDQLTSYIKKVSGTGDGQYERITVSMLAEAQRLWLRYRDLRCKTEVRLNVYPETSRSYNAEIFFCVARMNQQQERYLQNLLLRIQTERN